MYYFNKNSKFIIYHILFVCSLILNITTSIHAENYLSTEEAIIIGSASGGIGLLGTKINNIPENKQPVITSHMPFEESFQRWLGGECKIGKRNFLDDNKGAAVTPVISSILLTTVNLEYPRDDSKKDAGQDFFLFVSGLFATKGITDITKGIFARERPYQCILYDSTDTHSLYGQAYSKQSFFSGHTSGAFFSVTFLNLRLRDTMRLCMSKSGYDNWRWVSSGLLFSWGSFVGLSRVHAYKHHLSDVIVGAAAGILIGELFYNFNKNYDNYSGTNSPSFFKISIPL